MAAIVREHPPCKSALSELTVMRASELESSTHYVGRYLPLRIKSSVSEAAEIRAMDEHGDGVSVTVLYLASLAHLDDVLHVGRIIIIKEPFICDMRIDDRPPVLFVAHVSNIDWHADMDDFMPPSWRSQTSFPGKTAEYLRQEADRAFKAGRYHDAIST
jgi:hypothetical protein